ncbi:hypothetical protein [Paenibacillus tyrfis]|uniref:hypothetical protein n=1 Tax=Paenibacillus tyrfis TaxID=1501230 RepID=UPI0015C59E26|nr:hypothetical protein [Paenibacillus tyrfis]
MQAMQAHLIAIKSPGLVRLRRMLAPVMRRTPIFHQMRNKIALGVQRVDVNTSYFMR